MQFQSDIKRYTIAVNMMQYFYGFKEFRCTLKHMAKQSSDQYILNMNNVTKTNWK